MKYVASCSGGKDSVAMVLGLIEKEWPLDCVVFCDLGKEAAYFFRGYPGKHIKIHTAVPDASGAERTAQERCRKEGISL